MIRADTVKEEIFLYSAEILNSLITYLIQSIGGLEKLKIIDKF